MPTRTLSNKRSLFFKFLISYLLILFIPMGIIIMSYSHSSNVIKSQIENYNITILNQAKEVIDEHLKSIRDLSISIIINESIQSFYINKREMSSSDYYNMSKVVKQLQQYSNTENILYNLYLFNNNYDIVLTGTSKYDSIYFYNELSKYNNINYEKWKTLLLGDYFNAYMPAEQISVGKETKNVIACLNSLPIYMKGNAYGSLVQLIDADKIGQILGGNRAPGNGTVYIVDASGNIIISMGDSELIDKGTTAEEKGRQLYRKTINGQEAMVTRVASGVTDWTYVSAVPTEIFMDGLKQARNIMFVFLGLMECIGIALSIMLARMNYKPVKRIVTLLKQNLKDGEIFSGSKNEMDFIAEATKEAFKENKDIKNALDRQIPLLRANLLSQLLRGNYTNIDGIDQSIDSIGIVFVYDLFCVVSIDIEDYSDLDGTQPDMTLIKFLIENIIKEMDKSTEAIELEWNKMALILNISHENDLEKALNSIINTTRDLLKSKFNVVINAGVGNAHKGIHGINLSYIESLKAIEYMMFKGQSNIIYYKNICKISEKYIYPLESEIQLTNSVKTGSMEKSMSLLRSIISRNFKDASLSLDMARCLFFDIMSTAIKVLGDINVDYEKIFGGKFIPYEKLTNCKTVKEMQDVLEFIFGKVCEIIISSQESHSFSLKEEILQYIEKNYANPNLSLTTVADAFKMNSSYLSHFLKQHIQKNFLDHIRSMRIEKAEECLINSDKSIDDIARSVGYINSIVLIRNFKKLKHITPGQYRGMHSKNQNY